MGLIACGICYKYRNHQDYPFCKCCKRRPKQVIVNNETSDWHSTISKLGVIITIQKFWEAQEKNPTLKVASCCICFDEFEETADVRVTLCNHVFHNHCIIEWFKTRYHSGQHFDCPYCREII